VGGFENKKEAKKEELDFLETLLRNARQIQRQHKKEQVEQEFDPRKECLRTYTDLCLSMRMPCRDHLRISGMNMYAAYLFELELPHEK
jgi:hypothetical protein